MIPQNQGVQAWDRYAFVNNNPVRYVDPNGHMIACNTDSGLGCEGYGPSTIIKYAQENRDLYDNKLYPRCKEFQKGLSNDLESFLKHHPNYDVLADPLMEFGGMGSNGVIFTLIRLDYWQERSDGGLGEADHLMHYFDFHQELQVQQWDSSRLDWTSLAIDTSSFILSFIGLNPAAKLGKFAPIANVVSIGNAAENNDSVGTIFGFASFWPGPIGVGFSGASVLRDLSEGLYMTPYVPSISR